MSGNYMVKSLFLGLLLPTSHAFGQNYEQIAKQIVNTSAGVKPGELVMITGGQHTMPLMEAVAVEVARAGGQPAMLVSTDKVERSILMDTPEAAIQASKNNAWLLGSDVLITLPQYEDSRAVLAGLTPARDAKFSQAEASAGLDKKLDCTKLRGVFVNYPSKRLAANQQLDYPAYEQMVWGGISTDYSAIATQAQQLQKVLATGQKMHITSPNGTDLTVQLGGRPVFADDGVISAADQQEKLIYNRTARLPGGLLYGTCLENSATGRLAASTTQLMNQNLTGLKADVQNGQLTNLRAETGGEAFKEWLASYEASITQVSTFSIGLNPVMKPQEQKGFNPATAAGMVYLGIGNNELKGGQNQSVSGFTFPIANATVDIDGKTIVRNGQLVSAAVASAPARKKARK